MSTAGHPIGGVRDLAGYADIGAYGVLGDGRGAALVAPDGSIDWWAIPRLDSAPAFAALLDPDRGGRVELRPTDDDATADQRYLPHTNQLETVFTTSGGRVRVTDSLNSGNAGALPWSELARRVDGLEGSVEMAFVVAPGDGLRTWQPWAVPDDRGPVLHAGPVTMGVRHGPEISPSVDVDRVRAVFEVGAGERRTVAVVAAADDPVFLCDVDSIDRRIDLTTASWRRWAGQVRWEGQGREQVVRSALALKTLVIASTGAVAAAVTTSLPESVGGPKNWDYRYSWIRDAAFTIDALDLLGLQEEVHAAVSWLLHAIRAHGPDVHVMYTLDAAVPGDVRRPDVPGYRGSRPVQVGNAASGQSQLGIYGDLFGTVADWVAGGHLLDVRSSRELADLADRCADVWLLDDAGIWELPDDRPYTISKMNCWRALVSAAGLAEAGQLDGDGRRWRSQAEVVRSWVQEHCWSQRRQAYTFYAGTDDLDASVLLGAQFGFDTGPRMSTTVDAISAELGAGPLLYRYSGAHREEQTFTACAFWRAHALAVVGRGDEGRELLDQLAREDTVSNHLGLMTEMAAPGTGEQVGNLPQALSHLSYIRATNACRGAS